MLITTVPVTSRGVRLPDFNQSIRNRPAAVVENASGHDDALTERLSGMLKGQVIVSFRDGTVAVNRPGDLGKSVRQINQRLRGVAEPSGFVRFVESRGLSAGLQPAIRWNG